MVKNGNDVPIVLVENKKDLENSRKISFNEAFELASLWGLNI